VSQRGIPGPSSMPSTLTTVSALNSSPIMPVQSSLPFTTLKTLCEKVEKLPKSVPIAKKTGPLAGYCCDPMELTKDIKANIDVWETWDQRLNVLISHSIPDIYPLVTRGKYGLIALVQLLEHLVCDRKVDEGLLDGKIGRVLEAMDRHLRFLFQVRSFTDDFDFFSICKQRDTPKDAAPVETSHDPVPQPVTKKPAGKTSKGGRGSWVPPNVISPK
jgi:hypothetical protein